MSGQPQNSWFNCFPEPQPGQGQPQDKTQQGGTFCDILHPITTNPENGQKMRENRLITTAQPPQPEQDTDGRRELAKKKIKEKKKKYQSFGAQIPHFVHV